MAICAITANASREGGDQAWSLQAGCGFVGGGSVYLQADPPRARCPPPPRPRGPPFQVTADRGLSCTAWTDENARQEPGP